MRLGELKSFCDENGIICRENEPMSAHTTFGIGGAASLFIEPSNEGQVAEILKRTNDADTRLFVLGNGSNVLFPDEGFDGIVLHLGRGFSDIRLTADDIIECESGASITALTRFALDNSLSGLEFAYGIPGNVGGGVYMNAGAYGGELKDALISTAHVDANGENGVFSGDEMGLSYRHSAYSGSGMVITKAVFKLQKGDKEEIRAKMEDFMSRRREKQPLELPSAGSTFKRPEGAFAGALIEQCGLKGKKIGGAMVSEKHAGFVVNAGGATCADVLGLIELVQEEVLEKTGFKLEPEVRIVR